MPRPIRFLMFLGLGSCLAWGLHGLTRPATDRVPRPDAPVILAVEEIPAAPGEDVQGRQQWERGVLASPATGRIPAGMRSRELAFAANLPRRATSRPLDLAPGSAGDPAKFQGWTSRGPWNVGGRTRALAIDVSDPTYRTLLAGGVTGGLWRSTDDGESWHQVIGTAEIHQIQSLVQDTRPGHEQIW